MYFRFDLDAVLSSFTTYSGGLVVGKLESNAKLNSKLRLKLKLELNLEKINDFSTQANLQFE